LFTLFGPYNRLDSRWNLRARLGADFRRRNRWKSLATPPAPNFGRRAPGAPAGFGPRQLENLTARRG